MKNAINCPKCGADIPLTDAVAHSIREDLQKEFQQKVAEQESAFTNKTAALKSEADKLKSEREALDEELNRRLIAEKEEMMMKLQKEVRQQLEVEFKASEEQLVELKNKVSDSRAKELELLKEKEQLQEEKESMELEVRKQLDIERERIRKEAADQATEANRLNMAEREKTIQDLQGKISDLKQRAEQGSMQLQGEVLELDLEEKIAAAFPYDEITPISKGVNGADVHQQVRTNLGKECGLIVWETKRTKAWGGKWIAKLKEDMRSARGEVAVLVSQVLPSEVKGFGFVDGVWVCDYASALALATALRQGIVSVAATKMSEEGRQGKKERLYDYLCGTEFRQRVQALVEGFIQLKTDLEAEKKAVTKIWAKRDKQLEGLVGSTALMFGSIQGIAGEEALPDIASLQLPA